MNKQQRKDIRLIRRTFAANGIRVKPFVLHPGQATGFYAGQATRFYGVNMPIDAEAAPVNRSMGQVSGASDDIVMRFYQCNMDDNTLGPVVFMIAGLIIFILAYLILFELPEVTIFEDWSMIIKIGPRLW